jgi:hypothetical protein
LGGFPRLTGKMMMNIGDLTDEELQKIFLIYCAKLMLSAKQHGHSMAILEIDPKKVFGLPTTVNNADAGLLMISVAGGPSIEKLKQAVSIVMAEQ